MTKLLRIEKSTYTDQYGFEHDCYEIVEETEVEPTGQYYEYDYYGETIRNPKYWDDVGRRFTCMVATDYGGSSSWSRYVDGERVKHEKWIAQYTEHNKPRRYGLLPLIRKEAQ